MFSADLSFKIKILRKLLRLGLVTVRGAVLWERNAISSQYGTLPTSPFSEHCMIEISRLKLESTLISNLKIWKRASCNFRLLSKVHQGSCNYEYLLSIVFPAYRVRTSKEQRSPTSLWRWGGLVVNFVAQLQVRRVLYFFPSLFPTFMMSLFPCGRGAFVQSGASWPPFVFWNLALATEDPPPTTSK